MPGNTLVERKNVQRLFIHGQIYHGQLSEWFRVAAVPAYFGVSGAVILLLYGPFKYPDMIPGYMSTVSIYLAVILIANVVWPLLDVIKSTTASEEVMRKLQSKFTSKVEFMIVLEVGVHLKRSKALRSLGLPFGSFSNVTLGVPIVIVEEILNQLLFLLTL